MNFEQPEKNEEEISLELKDFGRKFYRLHEEMKGADLLIDSILTDYENDPSEYNEEALTLARQLSSIAHDAFAEHLRAGEHLIEEFNEKIAKDEVVLSQIRDQGYEGDVPDKVLEQIAEFRTISENCRIAFSRVEEVRKELGLEPSSDLLSQLEEARGEAKSALDSMIEFVRLNKELRTDVAKVRHEEEGDAYQ
jgi:hypothetical protein